MYQFTTTTIINSNLDSNGTTAKYAGTSTAFTVTRVNKFLVGNILSVTKRPYTAGVLEVAQIVVPTHTTGAVIRLSVDLRLSQSVYSEFANAYLYFKKPIEVEVIATGTAATDAAAYVTQINSLKNRFGNSYFTATASSATITLTANDVHQRFYSIDSQEQTANSNSIVQWDYISKASGTVTTPGAVGFGDDLWMISSVVVPTLENTRYYSVNKEERPIIGGNYTEYVIRYSVAKDGWTDGIVSGGTSITTHIFYVLSSLTAAFEAQLSNTFPAVITYGGSQTLVVIGDQNITHSTGANNYTVEGAVGTVNWTNTTLTGTTSANTTGILTVGSTTGTTTLTATDSLGNTGTLVITVV